MTSGRKAQGEDEYRRRLLAGLSGAVIEVGAGNGLNFPHYPDTVERVLAVEPEPLLRAAAIKAAAEAAVAVEVVEAVSGSLPAADGSFDAGVASLVLCSVPDQARALAEFHRVIKAGGALRFYELLVSHRSRGRRARRLLGATLYPHVAGGCHLTRDTRAAIEAAGFIVQHSRRFPFPTGRFGLPHILGSARRT